MTLRRTICIATGLLLASSGAAYAQSDSSTLTRVKKEGTMKVCYAQGSPESYKDPKTGEWLGAFVELANELAAWMNVKIQPVEVQWNTAVLALKRGDCDFFGSSFVYNAPRALEVTFIRPFRAKGLNAVIRKDNTKGLKTVADLNRPDIKIAVGLGSREFETAKRLFPKAQILALQIQADVESLAPTRRGDTDVTILPIININWWLQVSENSQWAKMAFPGENFGNANVGWAVRYGDQEWKDFLDMYSSHVAANKLVEAQGCSTLIT
ncbi:MAG: transporter substrate-binding domain-containing protein [Alphaproteobacteria bacterium]|nr:transporter substrate-binding domain-containing protein [Alphaproteobacteria bacterium]